LDRLVGSEIRIVTPEQYRHNGSTKLLQLYEKDLIEKYKKPYSIPVGGSNTLGTWGYIEIVRELATQINQTGQLFSDIVMAIGSGGTAAGIALGVKLCNMNIKVHAFAVCDSAAYFHNHINEIFNELNVPYKSEDLLDIIENYKGIGYAQSTTQELELIKNITFATGIIIDPVYTGKAINGLLQELQHNVSRFGGKNILFVHTGGLYSLYDKENELLPLLPKNQVQPFFLLRMSELRQYITSTCVYSSSSSSS